MSMVWFQKLTNPEAFLHLEVSCPFIQRRGSPLVRRATYKERYRMATWSFVHTFTMFYKWNVQASSVPAFGRSVPQGVLTHLKQKSYLLHMADSYSSFVSSPSYTLLWDISLSCICGLSFKERIGIYLNLPENLLFSSRKVCRSIPSGTNITFLQEGL